MQDIRLVLPCGVAYGVPRTWPQSFEAGPPSRPVDAAVAMRPPTSSADSLGRKNNGDQDAAAAGAALGVRAHAASRRQARAVGARQGPDVRGPEVARLA